MRLVSDELQGKTIAFLVAPEATEQVELTEPWRAVQDAGGSPHLDCQQSAEFTLPKPQSVDDCSTQVKPSDATSGTFTMSCKSATASGTGNGSYQVTDKSSATVKVSFKGTTAQGMPITYESTSVHKWIGSDCSAPPPGVDPSVAELLQ